MKKINEAISREVRKLVAKGDKDIDFSDIPEINPKDWQDAKRGQFFKPIKQQITVRLDADILDFFKSDGQKYQTRINDALREYMNAHKQRA